jgi:trigger factor
VKTSVTELGDSRVRLDVGVEPDAVERTVERAAQELGREMRIPGFRKGKVPAALVLQRVGRDAVLEQALRSSLPEWYERAVLDAGVTPVGDPKLDVSELPGEGEELAFSIEVAVRPKAKLGDYTGLEVGRADADPTDEAVDAELDRLREGFASLSPVDRPAEKGDLVLIDYRGEVDGEVFEGGEGTDQLVELGSESLVEGFEEGLLGAKAGDERSVEVKFPDDYRAEELAGKSATFAIQVKEVREKQLPELNDEFASDASEFETLEELRDEIRRRLAEALSTRAEADFREAAVDAAAERAQLDLPDELVAARAADRWERLEHSLSHRGVSGDAYLKMQGKTRDQVVEELKPEAERALRREATLAAIADAEGVEVSDEDMLAALGPGDGDDDPQKILERLRKNGRDALLREELRLRKAAEVVAESAKPIALDRAAARDRLWTPEKEREPAGSLWTPGQGEPDPS